MRIDNTDMLLGSQYSASMIVQGGEARFPAVPAPLYKEILS